MKLSKAQRQALADGTVRPFVRKLISDVKTKYPQAVRGVSDELLEQRIHFGIERARNYGMTWQSSLAGFVLAMFSSAPRFDEHPHMQALLNEASVKPNLRIRKLMRMTKNSTWAEIRKNQRLCQWPAELSSTSR